MVDDEDYDLLRVYSWRARRNKATWYAVTDINRKVTRMHRLIMGVTDPAIKVDHDDHNGLNNQRYNLHTSTDLENSANRVKLDGCYSMYKGVDRGNVGQSLGLLAAPCAAERADEGHHQDGHRGDRGHFRCGGERRRRDRD